MGPWTGNKRGRGAGVSSRRNKRLHQEVEEPSENARRWMQLGQAFQARRNDNTARTTTPQPAPREEQVPVVSGVAVITMPDGSKKMVLASEAHALAANESASQDDIENDTDEAGANVLPAGGQEDVEHGAHEAVASVLPTGDQDEVSGEKAEETAAEGATANETPQVVCGESIALPASPSVAPAPLQDVTNMSASVHAKEQRPIDNRDDEQRECERLKLEIARLQSLVATVVAERDHFKNELTALKDRVRARLHSLMEELQSDVTEDVETFRNDEDVVPDVVPAGGQDEVLGEQDEEGSEEGSAGEGTSGADEGKADLDPGKRGADTLKHVSRACGEPLEPPEKLVSIYEALSGDVAATVAIAGLLQDRSTVRGVEVRKIMSDLYRRVHSSLSEQRFVEWIAKHAPAYGMFSEFVMLDDSEKYASPLSAAESDFARTRDSTLTVSARALDAKPCELEIVSRQVAAMPTGAQRMCSARGVYFYTMRVVDSGIRLVYVGESVDVERRMNDHIDAIFEPDKADGPIKKRQGGHVLARAEVAGSSSAVEFDARVLMALNEDSAFELAKNYVDFCRKNSKFLPKTSDGILEVARAIGAVGFLAEAMFTVKYNSLNSESTATRIGMNISQPGIIHTSLPTKPLQLSLQQYQQVAEKAKEAKNRRDSTRSRVESRRLFKEMSLSGPGGRDRILELKQDDDDGNNFGAGHVYRAVTSAAPDAAPAMIDGDARVEVILTAKGQGNAGESVPTMSEEQLATAKGVISVPRFVIDSRDHDLPHRRIHYFMWDAAPLPQRKMLHPDGLNLFHPAPGDNATEDTVYYRCVDLKHAQKCARLRLQFFRTRSKVTKQIQTRSTHRNNAKYVLVPGHDIPAAKAKFYYGGEEPPLRNPLDAVMGRNGQATQAVARAVCETGADALAAANAFLSERIVWNTTVAKAMHFCVARSVSELPLATPQGTRTWRPPALPPTADAP